ncbi:Phosphoenolpyruvate-protein phosphotransferase [Petrocella atlantisensis]|uniref:Phosphoenolpyruvate-protein phosphotransferase n=1 Tax=Petrocella atlantisensis TaxID=2173034 RepID=A0A3P7P9Z9_9FIRM|nr:phosphoenolpyruvate--protein phosphotransferase [Petrocella atlantisensis]VDN46983.1 Phosphoenolpyruvate-protein phosphotransferase [Petrocella atlantisensis]
MIGVSVFKGVGIGKAFNYEIESIIIPKEMIGEKEIESTLDQLNIAIGNQKTSLEAHMKHVEETIGASESQIFSAHIEILNDPELTSRIRKNIVGQKMNLVAAIDEAKNFYVGMLSALEDLYIRERARDIEDVMEGLLKNILGLSDNPLDTIREDTILFAKDLSPSETIHLNDWVKGIVLSEGSITSHSAIVAKAKGIPTIVGYKESHVLGGTPVILDTITTQLLINPTEIELEHYREKVKEEALHQKCLKQLVNEKAITKDQRSIELFGNVGSAEEALSIVEHGGFGVGLLRTELVYMNSKDWPTEDEQYKTYESIAKNVNGEVIIRTLDIGGDKTLPYFTFPKEENPFLGLRAIRFCLKNKDIFKTQLRAILRLSASYPVKIMFPMIGSLEELIEARKCLDEAKKSLKVDNQAYNEDIPVGIMIEIPSAVFAIDLLSDHVDFVSIGTNDLCQYTLAVDRLNPEVAYLYDAFNISIIRMIDHVVRGCKPKGVKVGICGEMASDVEAAKILVGLGVDELSVSPSMIPYVKEVIISSNYEDLKVHAQRIIKR